MYCKYCGNKLDEQATFCSKCGKRIEENVEDHFFEEEKEVCKVEENRDSGGGILGLSIAGLIFAISTFIYIWVITEIALILEGEDMLAAFIVALFLDMPAIIFSAIARGKARRYQNQYGETKGAATVGKHIALVSLIISIVLAFVSIMFIFLL